MHLLYKIGIYLISLLLLLLIPMFVFLKEMAILAAINTGIIGLILIIVYFLLTFIYLQFGKKLFLLIFVLIIAMPSTWFFYKEWHEKREYEEWRNFSHSTPTSVNREFTEKDISIDTGKWAKYSFRIPYNGDIQVTSNHYTVELGLTLFNSERQPVGIIMADGKEITLEKVKKGETYYFLIDSSAKTKSFYVKLSLKQN
ncbi:MAG TPA: hypothetical protein VEV44_11905 [Pseudoneobacillus sp.]|nr:hypothetical protein [Pseudoneobacillus sp.]